MFVFASKEFLLSAQPFTLHEKRVIMLALDPDFYDSNHVEIDSQKLSWAYDITTECALETLRSSAQHLEKRLLNDAPVVTDVSYGSGVLRFTFTDEFRKIQDQPEKIDYPLCATWGLTVKAWRIMEILTVYTQTENKESVTINLKDLHRYMGATERQKGNFSQFRADVLDPSVELLSKMLEYDVTYEPIKVGKPVVELVFTMTPQW